MKICEGCIKKIHTAFIKAYGRKSDMSKEKLKELETQALQIVTRLELGEEQVDRWLPYLNSCCYDKVLICSTCGSKYFTLYLIHKSLIKNHQICRGCYSYPPKNSDRRLFIVEPAISTRLTMERILEV